MFKVFRTINKTYKRGTTLSEMLICLVLVGVVFTIAVGTMVADYHRNQTVVRLKKQFSIMSQVFLASFVDNGPYGLWPMDDNLSERGSYVFFHKYLKPYLVISRDCKNSIESPCDYSFKELDGTEKSLNSTWSRFYLNDGTFVALQAISKEFYKVVYFYIDTNGKKRLNVIGRDIFLFEFWIENKDNPDFVGQFLPFGHQYSREKLITSDDVNNCSNKTNGNYCSALILKDNWQIKDGYPWAQARYVVQ